MKTPLRRFALLAFVVAYAAGVPAAETVMLYLEDADGQAYISEATRNLVSAVESGVMHVFFDNGHIIFNSGTEYSSPVDTPFASERPSVRIAKAGGATLLLEVALGGEVEGAAAPERADFVFTDLAGDEVIVRGSVRLADVSPERVTGAMSKEETLCVSLGMQVARSALGGR